MHCYQGLSLGIAYATLVDMVELFDASYDEVTAAQTMKAAGRMAGSLIGSPMVDRFGRHLDIFLCFANLLFGLTSCAIPWAPSLIILGFLFGLSGFLHAMLNIGKYVFLDSSYMH